MKKIIIKGFYGYRNLGDDLLLKTTLEYLPNETEIYVCGGPFLEEFLAIREFKVIRKYIDKISVCPDIVIISGGGLFPQKTFRISFISKLLTPIKRFLTSHKTIMTNVGVVPKDQNSSKYFSFFLKKFDYISVRDNISKKYVESLLNKNIDNNYDLYFSKELEEPNYKRNNRLLCCIACPFSNQELSDTHYSERYKDFIKQISSLINSAITRFNGIDFLPFFESTDIKTAKLILDEIPDIKKCRILKRDVDFCLENIDVLFSSYEFGICMRFHSIVLSIRNGLPLLPICYDYKSEDLVRTVGLSEYKILYGIRNTEFFGREFDIVSEELTANFKKAINNKKTIQEIEYTEAEKLHNKSKEGVLYLVNHYL